MSAPTTGYAGAAFRAAETLGEAICTTPEWEEWDSARAAVRADPVLQQLFAQRRDMLNRAYLASPVGSTAAFDAELERLRQRIVQHPATVRQQAAVAALIGLLRTLNVALSGTLGVDFALLASPPKGGGCCG